MYIHPWKASLQYSARHPAGRDVKALHPPEAAGAARPHHLRQRTRSGGFSTKSTQTGPSPILRARALVSGSRTCQQRQRRTLDAAPSQDSCFSSASPRVFPLLVRQVDYRASARTRPMNFDPSPSVARISRIPSPLPFAIVRTAVHVQHLPGNVRSLGQINHGIHNLLNGRNASHWG